MTEQGGSDPLRVPAPTPGQVQHPAHVPKKQRKKVKKTSRKSQGKPR